MALTRVDTVRGTDGEEISGGGEREPNFVSRLRITPAYDATNGFSLVVPLAVGVIQYAQKEVGTAENQAEATQSTSYSSIL